MFASAAGGVDFAVGSLIFPFAACGGGAFCAAGSVGLGFAGSVTLVCAAGGFGGVISVPFFLPFPSPLLALAGGGAVVFNAAGGGGGAVVLLSNAGGVTFPGGGGVFNNAGGGAAVEFDKVTVVFEMTVAFPPANAVATFVAPCVRVTVESTVVGGRDVVCVTVCPWIVVVTVVIVPGWVSSIMMTWTEDDELDEDDEEELPVAPVWPCASGGPGGPATPCEEELDELDDPEPELEMIIVDPEFEELEELEELPLFDSAEPALPEDSEPVDPELTAELLAGGGAIAAMLASLVEVLTLTTSGGLGGATLALLPVAVLA